MILDEFERRAKEGLIAPDTPVNFALLTGDRWVEANKLDLFNENYKPSLINFKRSFSLSRFPAMTLLLCALQVALYVSVGGTQRVLPLDVLVAAGAKMYASIFEIGETWRLLTANVLHRDVLHLSFNMLFLFNVGGAIENAYRWTDYLLILVSAALGTTLVSVVMSDSASVGASGMVLGMFGAALVFGYKYGDDIEARYRRFFGGAVLPFVLLILCLGFVSENTDNWGHLGGFAGGLVAAVPLVPRLLIEPGVRQWRSLGVATLLVVSVFGAGPLLRQVGVPLRTVTDTQVGLQIAVPARWRPGLANHLGYASWSNPLGVRIAATHRRSTEGPVLLAALRRQFTDEVLQAHEREGDIADVRVVRERPMLIDGGRAIVVDIALESRGGPQMTRNLLIERGYYAYTVVMSAPVAWFDAYEPIFDRLANAITLVDTDALIQSRKVVDTFAGMSSAHVEYADQLALLGRVEQARQRYAMALDTLPELADAHFGWARLALDYHLSVEEAAARVDRLHRRYPEQTAYAALLADLRQRLGQMDEACVVLQETLDRTSASADDLRARIRTLRCRSEGWLGR